MAIEAFRLAVRAMTPVVFLSDGYLANSSEPWRIPDPEEIPRIEVVHRTDPDGFLPVPARRGDASAARGSCPARPRWSTASAAWANRT